MSFTKSLISKFETGLKDMGGVLFQECQVDLYQLDTVKVKLYVGTRRANDSDLTAGATDTTQLVATIDADDWDAKAGRPPQKGDLIYWNDKRYAVDRAQASNAGGNRVFYKARLEG